MAHWFHRNPIKATENVTFDLKYVAVEPQCVQLCKFAFVSCSEAQLETTLENKTSDVMFSNLYLSRKKLLTDFVNAHIDSELVTTDFVEYVSLFLGFIYEIQNQNLSDIDMSTCRKSKLLPLLRFKWSNSVVTETTCEVNNSWFELLNIVMNMGFWLMKHAASVSAKDQVSDAEARIVHLCLRRAAGMFIFVASNTDKVDADHIKGHDLDRSVLSAYTSQCTAEAQEIALARAIELKHSASLISDLAYNTSCSFTEAENFMKEQDQAIFGKWRLYLLLKAQIYVSYAYAFLGEQLLASDKCGEAIRACQEGMSCFQIAEDYVQKYSSSSGPGVNAKPESHLFYRRIKPLLLRHLEKAERENGFIYHQNVPEECPLLEESAKFGVAKAEEFKLPLPNPAWISSYALFNLSKASLPDFSKIRKSGKSLPQPVESKLYETDTDPNTVSGCAIS